jgi:hypothetical protein
VASDTVCMVGMRERRLAAALAPQTHGFDGTTFRAPYLAFEGAERERAFVAEEMAKLQRIQASPSNDDGAAESLCEWRLGFIVGADLRELQRRGVLSDGTVARLREVVGTDHAGSAELPRGLTYVGRQELNTTEFASTGAVYTSSWLGPDFQGIRIGPEMRMLLLHTAFELLGAREVRSWIFEDNMASQGLVRKLGFEPVDSDVQQRQGHPARRLLYRMDEAGWQQLQDGRVHTDRRGREVVITAPAVEHAGFTPRLLARLGVPEGRGTPSDLHL